MLEERRPLIQRPHSNYKNYHYDYHYNYSKTAMKCKNTVGRFGLHLRAVLVHGPFLTWAVFDVAAGRFVHSCGPFLI